MFARERQVRIQYTNAAGKSQKPAPRGWAAALFDQFQTRLRRVPDLDGVYWHQGIGPVLLCGAGAVRLSTIRLKGLFCIWRERRISLARSETKDARIAFHRLDVDRACARL